MIKDAHDALVDIQSSGRSKELLAQVLALHVCIVLPRMSRVAVAFQHFLSASVGKFC